MTTTATAEPPTNQVVARATGLGTFQHSIGTAGHTLIVDEPVALGGLGTGPNPYDYLAAALAACTSMTVKLYAARRSIQLPAYAVEVTHSRVHATDCASCAAGTGARIDRFELRLAFDEPIDAELQAKVLDIAGKCPVHRTLSATSEILSSVRVPDLG